jgi:hypothetical protein
MGIESIVTGLISTGVKAFGGITSLINPLGTYLGATYDVFKTYAKGVYEYLSNIVRKILNRDYFREKIYDRKTKTFKIGMLEKVVNETLKVYKDIKTKYLSKAGRYIKKYATKLYDKLKKLCQENPAFPPPRYDNWLYVFVHNLYYSYLDPLINYVRKGVDKAKKVGKTISDIANLGDKFGSGKIDLDKFEKGFRGASDLLK